MAFDLPFLGVVRAATALLAVALAARGYRAYRRTGRAALLRFAAGTGALAVGFLLAGGAYQASGDLAMATALEAPFTLAALALLAWGVFGRDWWTRPFRPRAPDRRA